MEISYAKIYPPIGIARLGDSTDDEGWFVIPDEPHEKMSSDEKFSYRDAHGAIKRQAAEFRIVAFDANDEVIGELHADEARVRIQWTVELANTKAEWYEFRGTGDALGQFRHSLDLGPAADAWARRNSDTRDRSTLRICPGPRDIAGISQQNGQAENADKYSFIGRFRNSDVYLGELRTDRHGRLLVLGGRGVSRSVADNEEEKRDQEARYLQWIQDYANNDSWHDDTSDGPVRAAVEVDGNRVPVKGGAWVIVAPPDFAPDIGNIVTLYDAMEDAALRHRLSDPLAMLRPTDQVEYWHDIAPILARLDAYSWVNELGLRGHGFQKSASFLNDRTVVEALSTPSSSIGSEYRSRIFSVIREPVYDVGPEASRERAKRQATAFFMPPLSGDEGDRAEGEPRTWLSVTRAQHERLRRWQEGDFMAAPVAGSKVHASAESLALPESNPRGDGSGLVALIRSVLERACGGAFYPGIEITSICREKELYSEAFRIDTDKFQAGDMTKYMACPWQADFYECRDAWWPAQRPDSIIQQADYEEILKEFPDERREAGLPKMLFTRKSWARNIEFKRPSPDGLLAVVIGATDPAGSSDQYRADVLDRLVDLSDPGSGLFSGLIATSTRAASVGGRVPSPWRVQYVAQEELDRFNGRFLRLRMASPQEFVQRHERESGNGPESKGRQEASCPQRAGADEFHDLRYRWPSVESGSGEAEPWEGIRDAYVDFAVRELRTQIERLFGQLPPPEQATATALRMVLADLYRTPPSTRDEGELHDGDPAFASHAIAELLQSAVDLLYLSWTGQAGDNGMVQAWRELGFVTEKSYPYDGKMGKVYVETDRNRYDGMSYRDYFYLLMNIEKYPDFYDYGPKIADKFLQEAQDLIDSKDMGTASVVEIYFDYSPVTLSARLEEIYENFRRQAEDTIPWQSDSNRDDVIRRRISLAPFNQTDGAWLRFIANAGPEDEIHALLFDIWSDEVGNGDPGLHHGNLYTTFLRNLGIYLPDVTSREYADHPFFSEYDFGGAVFQLVVSQYPERYFPEILGMTLFLEWEVLELAQNIKLFDYLGIDSQFWRMHVGIDNAVGGHGYKARRAVELYLDRVLNESGPAAQQQEWKRIWRGFIGFATAGYTHEGNGNDAAVANRRPAGILARMRAMIARKAHYGRLNHRDKRLGTDRLNDLFDEPETLLTELARSRWIVPGDPKQSELLNYLTTYSGPMYKVFDRAELALWEEWIEWLGRQGDTSTPKCYFNKEESMIRLLETIKASALASVGHRTYRLDGNPLVELFGKDVRTIMRAIRDPANGWITPYQPENSALVVDLLSAGRRMGRALDKRFPEINNQIGRKIIVDWIEAGCPVDREAWQARLPSKPSRAAPYKQAVVQVFGRGSVH